jgi:hypothetical protein
LCAALVATGKTIKPFKAGVTAMIIELGKVTEETKGQLVGGESIPPRTQG